MSLERKLGAVRDIVAAYAAGPGAETADIRRVDDLYDEVTGPPR